VTFRINHIHIKAKDPRKTAEWWAQAFNFKIVGDDVRDIGDRFVRCLSEDGAIGINISNARTGDKLNAGDAGLHWGLEHFGIDTLDIEKDVARLVALGAVLQEPPVRMATGARIAFLSGPDDVRFELVEKKA
jgi:catechol 2,3-dioxygenase-like lactoylglutathione lyase family enzyme